MGLPESDAFIGLELHGFIVTHALRSGGMGHVYEAKHPLIGHRVAIKALRPELSGSGEVNARFLREARAMSAVKHRNVVEIHNFGQLPFGGAYLMMELIEGETLSEIIAREAPMSPVRALQLCEEILAALAAAHAVGVVHRDLKPGNIVLMPESSGDLVVKVLDFGLARQLDVAEKGDRLLFPAPDHFASAPQRKSSLSPFSELDGSRTDRESTIAGTPEYISPEQASGKPVDGRGDLYALGVILFEMLTGRLPFEAESGWDLLQLHRSAVPPLVSTLVSDTHRPLEAFVDQLLSKDPAKRAESAKAARARVQQLEAEIAAIPMVVTPLLGPVVRQLAPPSLPRAPLPIRPIRKFRFASRAAGLLLLAGAASVLALGFTSSAASMTFPLPKFTVRALSGVLEPRPVSAPEPQRAALPEAPIVEPLRAAPAVHSASAQRIRRKAPQARAVPKISCEANEAWRFQLQQQLEHLEQLSIAAIPDSASPSLVADVKARARALASALSSAQGSACAQVEAQVFAWKASIR